MRIIGLFLCVLASTPLFSQTSVIEYDFSTETFTFGKIKKNGKYVQTPKPVQYYGVPTKLTINNINTNYYGVDFEVKSFTEKPINSDQNMSGLIENFTAGTSAFNQLIGEVKQNDIYKSLWVDGEFQGVEGLKNAFGMGQTEFQQKMEILTLKLEAIEETQNDLKKVSNSLAQTFEKIELIEFVNEELLKLQMNAKLSPDELKTRAQELIEKVLVDTVSIEGVIRNSNDMQSRLTTSYGSFKSKHNTLQLQKEDAKAYISEFLGEIDQENFSIIVTGISRELETEALATEQNAKSLDQFMDKYQQGQIRRIYATAFDRYDEIAHSNYSVTYTINGAEDMTTVSMKFRANVIDTTLDEPAYIKTRQFEMPTKGGLRVNSSAGMAFTTFAKGQYTYTSEKGIVDEKRADLFKPSLTTMFHFYKQSASQITFGGNFGIAVPIEGDKDFQYLLGGSAIIGKTQRVILNLGVFGGKNQVLSGYSIGDKISAGSEVPTTGIFDYGLFGGVTLNIGQIF